MYIYYILSLIIIDNYWIENIFLIILIKLNNKFIKY